jgi:hypothetical protein
MEKTSRKKADNGSLRAPSDSPIDPVPLALRARRFLLRSEARKTPFLLLRFLPNR